MPRSIRARRLHLRSSVVLAVAASFLRAATAADAYAEPPRLAEPWRDDAPVVVTGAEPLAGLIGQPCARIVAFAWQDGWRQIPVQVDERHPLTIGPGRGHTQSETILVYADAERGSGPDEDPLLDADDEVVVLWRDLVAGDPPAGDPPGCVAGSRRDLAVVDPLVSGVRRRLVLAVGAQGCDPAAGRSEVAYDFKLLKGAIAGGGQREDTTLRGASYELHWTGRWTIDVMRVTAPGASGVDLLDAHKFQFKPGNTGRTTGSFDGGAGRYLANRVGPLRVVRSVMGSNSGPFSQRDMFCYRDHVHYVVYTRVHGIPGLWDYFALTPEAVGMTYRDNHNPDGLAIDGKPDDAKTGLLLWQLYEGAQGSIACAFSSRRNFAKGAYGSYYFDDADSQIKTGVGSNACYGAAGPAFIGSVPDTDVGSGNHLMRDRWCWFGRPGWGVADAQARATAAWHPLRVEAAR